MKVVVQQDEQDHAYDMISRLCECQVPSRLLTMKKIKIKRVNCYGAPDNSGRTLFLVHRIEGALYETLFELMPGLSFKSRFITAVQDYVDTCRKFSM